MGSLTDFTELEVLDHILKTGAYSPPATPYLSLHTADPTDAGLVAAEATYTGYQRAAITFGTAASRAITQNAQVNFPACTAGSSVVTHWGICASGTKTTSDLLAYGAFNASKTITAGYAPFVATTKIQVNFAANGVVTAYANSILDWLFRGQTLAQPANIYIALHSTACTDTTPGTELTGGGYARIVNNTWDVAVAGASKNTNAITFAVATGDWTTAIHASIYDAVTSGTYMLWLDVNDLTILNGEYARFIAAALNITLG